MSALDTPRLRMFAGPNGSGKSTMKAQMRPELLEFYLNPDDIEAAIAANEFFDFSAWQIAFCESELREFLANSALLQRAGLTASAAELRLDEGKLTFAPGQINSYFASVIADFVRRKMVAARRSFTFETVMSSPDKIEFLRAARGDGFRIYLYFVATQDPDINVARVANRVRAGGHDVPRDKILARYTRSLELLSSAIAVADRAYIFDNSSSHLEWLAEFENGRLRQQLTASSPLWFEKYALENSRGPKHFAHDAV